MCISECVCPLPTLPIQCHAHLIDECPCVSFCVSMCVSVYQCVWSCVCVCVCPCVCLCMCFLCACVSVCVQCHIFCTCYSVHVCINLCVIQIHSTTAMQFPSNLTSLYPSIIDECPHVSFYVCVYVSVSVSVCFCMCVCVCLCVVACFLYASYPVCYTLYEPEYDKSPL